jgi:hypothetical protein
MRSANPVLSFAWGSMLLASGALLVAGHPAQAGPVVCTTTLEAPVATAAPVELTRCGRIQTVPELVVSRFYTHTAPFERGVNLTHQITDLLGLSLGGADGSRRLGFGFPDQTIVYDGTAVQNTTAALLEAQNTPLPLRTADLSPCFTTSQADTSCSGSRLAPRLSSYGMPYGGGPTRAASGYALQPVDTVRGLW